MAKCKNCKNLDHILNSGVSVGRWCVEKSDSPDIDRERICDKFVPMSQGDRIRNMTDEELAEFLDDIAYCCKGRENETYCSNCRFYFLGECNCVSIGEWLKSEVGCE